MLGLARRRAAELALTNVDFREGRAETIPAEAGVFDAVLASLSLMYAIDRGAAARELWRVPPPGGRFVAAVWAPLPTVVTLFCSSRLPGGSRLLRLSPASAPGRLPMQPAS